MSLDDRYTKALRKKSDRGFSGYPIATIAHYGPDDGIATKVAVGIVLAEGEDPAYLERWLSRGNDIRVDHEVNGQILRFIRSHGAKSVVLSERILGCAHEEGVDYPEGATCPRCPYWANRDRWTGTKGRR